MLTGNHTRASRARRFLLRSATLAALLVMSMSGPVSAVGPVIGDDGLPRPGPYVPDVIPAWKVQLLALHNKMQAGTVSAADAAEWNAIIDAHGIDPLSRLPDATASSTSFAPMAAYTQKVLNGTQQPQLKTYYCGPGSAQSVVLSFHTYKGHPTMSAYDGQSLSQAHLATSTYLNTEATQSTDWVDHDMTHGLNYWIFAGDSQFFQSTPTSVADLRDHVTTDIDVDWMLASDMSEVIGGSHYNHHPNKLILHWTTIRGYASSGATLYFQDPAANTTVLGGEWANVAAYFSMSSTSTYGFMTQNYTRGIVW